MPFDALVVLGCPVRRGALPPPAARRVARAARAYEEGLATRVVVTGGRVWQGLVEADAFAGELVQGGVPEQALLLERASHTTRENARFTARLVKPLGIRRVGLVTCDWHLPRALFCFRRVGLEPEAVPAPSPEAPLWRWASRLVREGTSFLLDWALLERAAGGR